MIINNDYLRGLFDGEGCVNFSVSRGYRQPRIQITNTSLPLLQEIKAYFITQGYKHAYLGRKNPNSHPPRKPCYDLVLRSKHDVVKFINEVGANIPSKQAKLKEVEAYCKLNIRYFEKNTIIAIEQMLYKSKK